MVGVGVYSAKRLIVLALIIFFFFSFLISVADVGIQMTHLFIATFFACFIFSPGIFPVSFLSSSNASYLVRKIT